MAQYLIGDIQGCHAALHCLLAEMGFSPSRDTLYPLGDLVNRGEDSLGVLQTLMGFGNSVKPVLGNHDLHLLAVAVGAKPPSESDTLQALLQPGNGESATRNHARARPPWWSWLLQQPLSRSVQHGDTTWLLVHAGLLPQWSIEKTGALAAEVQSILRALALLTQATDGAAATLLQALYGNTPSVWSDDLRGPDRLRIIVNALTRLRFCTPEGEMCFTRQASPAVHRAASPSTEPSAARPWFEVYGPLPPRTRIAFGHWSTLGLEAPQRVFAHEGYLCLDSGCVWGGWLSAYCLDDGALIQVKNPMPMPRPLGTATPPRRP